MARRGSYGKRSRFRSVIVEWALTQRDECRADYELLLMAEHERAAEACRGRLLSAKAMRDRRSSFDLFLGNQTRARAWASEELLRYWDDHPRPNFEDFENQWWRERAAELGIPDE